MWYMCTMPTLLRRSPEPIQTTVFRILLTGVLGMFRSVVLGVATVLVLGLFV